MRPQIYDYEEMMLEMLKAEKAEHIKAIVELDLQIRELEADHE